MRRLNHPTFADAPFDTIVGSIHPFEVYNGTEGDDTHTGTNSDDTLNGNGGNDTLNGGDGSDLIDGGAGNDALAGDAGDDVVNGGIGNDTITSTSGIDTVDGGDGYDKWIGAYASATGPLTFDQRLGTLSDGTTITGIEAIQLTTGSSADQFTMNGEQTFSIDAGGGVDAFTFNPTGGSRAAAPLIVMLGIGSNYLNVTIQDGTVTNLATHFEQLAITGSSGDDLFVIPDGKFAASPATLALDGGDGVDKLTWDMTELGQATFEISKDGSINSNFATLANFEAFDLKFSYAASALLGAGDDIITSSYGGLIKGGAGNDTITTYRDSHGEIYGGIGNDTITAGGTEMKVFGNDGDDVIQTYYSNITVDGGLGYDRWSDDILYKTDYNQATNKFSNGVVLINVEGVKFTTSHDYRAGQ